MLEMRKKTERSKSGTVGHSCEGLGYTLTNRRGDKRATRKGVGYGNRLGRT